MSQYGTKKEIPIPAVVGVVVVAVAIGGFFLSRAGQTQEFKGPDVPKVIPKYVADTMDAKALEQMKKDGYKVEDVAPPADAGSGSSAAPSGPTMPSNIPGGAGLGGPKGP
jgi:hypothetical protein